MTIDGDNMLLICENNICKVYDDGDNYRMVSIEGEREDKLISKEDHLPYPLALCLKWDFTPVDIDYLNKLSDSLDAWYKKRGH